MLVIIFLVLTILNAAPASADLDTEFFRLSDIFCVNETEVKIECEFLYM